MNQPTAPTGPRTPSTLQRMEELQDQVGRVPQDYAERCYLAEVSATGATGPSIGHFPLHPVETLEDRLLEVFGAPFVAHIRIKRVGQQGFVGPFLFELSASAARLAPAQQQSDQQEIANEAARRSMPAVSSVPTNPFDGAMSVLDVVDKMAERLEQRAQRIAQATGNSPAQPPQSMEALIELAKTAAGTETALDKALPAIVGIVGPAIAALTDGWRLRSEARRIEAAAYYERTTRHPLAVEPPQEQTAPSALLDKGKQSHRPTGENPAESEPDNEPGANTSDEGKRKRPKQHKNAGDRSSGTPVVDDGAPRFEPSAA